MMIRNDHRHSKFFRPGDCGLRRNSIVTGDNRIHAIGVCRFHQPYIHPIPIHDPVWDIIRDICPCLLQPLIQNIIRCDAIYIVIGDNTDFLSCPNLFFHNLAALVHVLH